jgi:hypothetical protein
MEQRGDQLGQQVVAPRPAPPPSPALPRPSLPLPLRPAALTRIVEKDIGPGEFDHRRPLHLPPAPAVLVVVIVESLAAFEPV